MARLSAAVLLTVVLLSCLPMARTPQEPSASPGEPVAASQEDVESPAAREEMVRAGVCARCHVVSVLEWGVSAHVEERTTCKKCHGPSEAHVANERNEVSPDRLPRGAAIAELCLDCHDEGCPETEREDACQECHHPHALVHPGAPPPDTATRLKELRALWKSFRDMMEEGESLIKLQEWTAALGAFRAAQMLVPGDDSVRMRIRACERRLKPELPGFEIVGDEFDSETGLPLKVKVPGLDMTMLLVVPGAFDMGADHFKDSRPVHTVRVEPYYLGEFEVTQGQWQHVLGANPSTHPEASGEAGSAVTDRLPVETVSWDDCQTLIGKLNKSVSGGGFRLPTEAEWEYACRAGARETVGEDALVQVAWFVKNSERTSDQTKPFRDIDAYAPRVVGTREPNRWGFHDMQGNVSEWCASPWRPYPFDASDASDASDNSDADDDGSKRVLRGGSYPDTADLLHPALRHPERPHRRFRWNGLRLARTVGN
jgi:formylglycine-generating enzyme required for sulfatase activity